MEVGDAEVTLANRLDLNPVGDGAFEAPPPADSPARLFGGLLIGQALAAALRTVDADRPAHSIHAHFLRPGSGQTPMHYSVQTLRDGRSFSVRQVTASQRGKPALIATVSCQLPEPGLAYSPPMPDVPGPDGLRTEQQVRLDELALAPDTKWVRSPFFPDMHFDLRPVHPRRFARPEPRPPRQLFWVRLDEAAPRAPREAQAMLAYLSDMMLLSTALLPHGIYWTTTAMQEASLDHAMWFHAPASLDQWMLWDLNVEWTGTGRGLVRGRIFAADGTLLATVAQEGLIRLGSAG